MGVVAGGVHGDGSSLMIDFDIVSVNETSAQRHLTNSEKVKQKIRLTNDTFSIGIALRLRSFVLK